MSIISIDYANGGEKKHQKKRKISGVLMIEVCQKKRKRQRETNKKARGNKVKKESREAGFLRYFRLRLPELPFQPKLWGYTWSAPW